MIRKAVFPVAGMGTRFLPATKASPKEMLPLVDRPLIQYVVEEVLQSGIKYMIFVTGRNKRPIEDYFDASWELESILRDKERSNLLADVDKIRDDAEFIYVRQPKPLGLGHAVLMSSAVIDNEPFAVVLGDDIINSDIPALKQLINVYERYNSPVLALERVPEEEVSNYGIALAKPIPDDERVLKINDLIEKPEINEFPSNYAVIGRYILVPEIFEILRETKPGRGGEIQLTDALRTLCSRRLVLGVEIEGKRYDCGSKIGYLKATVDFALQHPEFKVEMKEHLKQICKDL
ncbi:UTP--glucose-1-phosphate uridylyltransferase GalU [Thermodesulfobium sp.]|jgi:UTP--glucose-1-phosphate uridylyltransferase|uniref:UTP--glucose-1-phosphate uridylyltransferase n=1 Tax=Thermodesulfobium narugense TaxID=184064 RepID=A0A7C5PRE3_9BACT